jgi:hypothetical protein
MTKVPFVTADPNPMITLVLNSDQVHMVFEALHDPSDNVQAMRLKGRDALHVVVEAMKKAGVWYDHRNPYDPDIHGEEEDWPEEHWVEEASIHQV